MKDAEDEVLIGRVVAGDEEAFSELYGRYRSLVYGTGMRYLGDRALAEDLVQDVFLAVWRNASSFDPSKASFATWIHRITRNRATDFFRRRKVRSRSIEESPGEPGEEDPTEGVLRGFEVFDALSSLPPEYREVIFLAYFRGLSQREISEMTGIPLGTVKSRTTAALRALRQRLYPEDPGG